MYDYHQAKAIRGGNTGEKQMNTFKNDALFVELVAAHKAGLKMSRSKGNLSAYRALVQKQMNLQEKIMRKYDVTFFQLNGSMIQA